MARPLAEALRKAGFEVWYDEFSLKIGDSLRRSIENGLATCDHGVVILSPSFFAKKWPQDELDGLLAREFANRARVLPVWKDITFDEIAERAPILAGRLAVDARVGVDELVREIRRATTPVGEEPEDDHDRVEPVDKQTPSKLTWKTGLGLLPLFALVAALGSQGGFPYIGVTGAPPLAYALTMNLHDLDQIRERGPITCETEGETVFLTSEDRCEFSHAIAVLDKRQDVHVRQQTFDGPSLYLGKASFVGGREGNIDFRPTAPMLDRVSKTPSIVYYRWGDAWWINASITNHEAASMSVRFECSTSPGAVFAFALEAGASRVVTCASGHGNPPPLPFSWLVRGLYAEWEVTDAGTYSGPIVGPTRPTR